MGQETNLERGWGAQEAERYRRSRHGPDGKLWLDRAITLFLARSRGQGPMLDVGTGAAAVPIEAVREHGVEFVFGIDNSPAMLAMAEKSIAEARLRDRITAKLEDAKSLPYEGNEFRRVTSVNVACNLDPETLAAHLREMARVVTPDGQILFAVPINLMDVFSNGDTGSLRKRLMTSLAAIKKESAIAKAISQESIQRNLGDIEELHRGTFIERSGHLQLVARNSGKIQSLATAEDLAEGTRIWRKLPGLVVPNIYHSQSDYDIQIAAAGLQVADIITGNFHSEFVRARYNSQVPDDQPGRRLGAEYVGKGPFAVYILAKAA